jgi:hypothetical protein
MANLLDTIVDYYPPASGVGLPLSTKVSVTFDRLMDVSGLQDTLIMEGPDTDQYVGAGLLELSNPNNISQGDLNNFLRSPGYRGIVEGKFDFETISGVRTKVTFTPNQALFPSTGYTVHQMETPDASGNTVSGNLTWSFDSGSGSIQELPSNLSTSVLASLVQNGWVATPTAIGALRVVKVTPADHSVECDVHLDEIVVEFDKPLDPLSIDKSHVYVETLPVTDHPSAPVFAQGELMTTLEVSGCLLKIKL